MSQYRRGLREPHLEFLACGSDTALVYPRVIFPIPTAIARDLRAAFDLSIWPTFRGRLEDALKSFGSETPRVAMGTYPETTDDPDEPEALWLTVIIPVPCALLDDPGYDATAALYDEVEAAAVLYLRQFQTGRYYVEGEPGLAPHA